MTWKEKEGKMLHLHGFKLLYGLANYGCKKSNLRFVEVQRRKFHALHQKLQANTGFHTIFLGFPKVSCSMKVKPPLSKCPPVI